MTNNNHLFLDIHVIQTAYHRRMLIEMMLKFLKPLNTVAQDVRVSVLKHGKKLCVIILMRMERKATLKGVRTLNVVQYVANKILKLGRGFRKQMLFSKQRK